MQEAAKRGDNKRLYMIIKELSSRFKVNSGVAKKSRNGTSLSTEREQLERWKEHFSDVLNQDEPDAL